MKITAQEEYGLRVLLRIASCKDAQGMSITQLSKAEGLSHHYVAKLTRILRMGGFINSTPGLKGGYVLARPANHIVINEVLQGLGGMAFDKEFCLQHTGTMKFCTNSVDCSARSLWQMIQLTLNRLLDNVTLYDLINTEKDASEILVGFMEHSKLLITINRPAGNLVKE